MKKIDDPKNKASIQQIMRDGMSSEFWQIICEALDENIAYYEGIIYGGDPPDWPVEEYKAMMQTMINRRHDIMRLKDLPNTISTKVESPDQTEPRLDVYDTVEDMDEAESET